MINSPKKMLSEVVNKYEIPNTIFTTASHVKSLFLHCTNNSNTFLLNTKYCQD